MERFTIDFENALHLKAAWFRSFAGGTCMVPSGKSLSLQSEVALLLRVPSESFGILIPTRVLQVIPPGNGQDGAIVFEMQGVANFRGRIEDTLQSERRTGVLDCTVFSKLKSFDSPEGKTVVQRCRTILKQVESKDLYGALGLDPKASRKEIRNAYFALTRDLHPDHFPPAEFALDLLRLVERAYQGVSQAYETLRDEKKRAAYDLTRGIMVRAREESLESYKARQSTYMRNRRAQESTEQGDRQQQVERLFLEASKAAQKGEKESAILTLRIALQLDPAHPGCKAKMKELTGR